MSALAIEGPDPTCGSDFAWTQPGHLWRTGSERVHVTSIDPRTGFVTKGGSHGFDVRTAWTIVLTGPTSRRVGRSFFGLRRTGMAQLMPRWVGRLGGAASRAAMRTDLDDVARGATGAAT